MGVRNASPYTFRASGVCDVLDGSNGPQGAMSALKNLIPNPRNLNQYVPRPASVQMSNFSGFTTPGQGDALLVIGSRAYGMIASGRNAGKDEPFCFDLSTGTFVTIANVTATNCPASPAAGGEWSPPSMAQVGNRIMITHPGYSGANRVGWIDLRNFTSTPATGDTHTNTTIDNLSANPLNVGWAVGDRITGAGIPANTFIVSMTATAVTLSQATTTTAAGVALTVTSGTTAAPMYGAGNTNTNGLPATPAWVTQFNGRAYYAVNNGVQWSDSLKPWQITNAAQALTLGDDKPVTCIGGLPLSGQLGTGIVQSLIVFKGSAPYWQITGDQATSDLRQNQVAGSIGTEAPLTVVPTTKGLAYVAPDGLRIIDALTAIASDPIGAYGAGVTVPFIYAVSKSRMCAAFNKNILRVSVQNGAIDSQAVQEFWYHFSANTWTGPHDFPAGIIAPCFNGETDFVLFASGVSGKLWESTVSPSAASTYTENGAVMNMMWTTALWPDNPSGNASRVVESSVGLVLPATQALTIQASDELGNALDVITLSGDQAGQSVWGSFAWGGATWGGATPNFRQIRLPWSNALVFKQASLNIFGPCVSGFVIGDLIAKVQPTSYQGAYSA